MGASAITRSLLGLTIALGCCLPSVAEDLTIDLSRDPNAITKLAVKSANVRAGKATEVAGDRATVTVTCQAPVDCGSVSILVDGSAATVATSARTATLAIEKPANAVTSAVSVRSAGAEVIAFDIGFKAPGGGNVRPAVDTTCRDRAQAIIEASHSGYGAYNRWGNLAGIVISPEGAVYDRFGAEFSAQGKHSLDENDDLEVFVYGPAAIVGAILVKRTSTIRTLGEYRVIGQGSSVQIDRQALGDACAIGVWTVGDFEPGAATIAIQRLDRDPVATIGTVEFNVSPLYSGMFSFGGVWSDLLDPDPTLVSNGTDMVIAPSNVGGDEFLYSLFFTPFIWGARDLEKPGEPVWHRINPTMGLVLDNVDDHALVGLSVDLPRGFLLTYGKHFRKVKQLDGSSGLMFGSTFSGMASELPVSSSWEDDDYYGFSIDLRAAVKFFAALGTKNK